VRTAVVTSAVPERRRQWAKVFSAEGTRVLECSGPLVDCPLLRGERECTFLAGADLAVYDLDSVTPLFLPTLLRKHAGTSILFARDALSPGREHTPSVRRVHFARRARATCFGAL
jgi:hypothetical protein